MNKRTLNAETDYVEFERDFRQKSGLLAVIHGHTKAIDDLTINARLDFDCLAYIVPDLQEAWKKEKADRLAAIGRVDAAFPQ